MKKTAVEWLIGRFHYEGFIGTYCSEEQIKSKRQIMIEIIEQAKEMEKEQLNDACYDGYYQEGMYDTRAYYDNKYKQQ